MTASEHIVISSRGTRGRASLEHLEANVGSLADTYLGKPMYLMKWSGVYDVDVVLSMPSCPISSVAVRAGAGEIAPGVTMQVVPDAVPSGYGWRGPGVQSARLLGNPAALPPRELPDSWVQACRAGFPQPPAARSISPAAAPNSSGTVSSRTATVMTPSTPPPSVNRPRAASDMYLEKMSRGEAPILTREEMAESKEGDRLAARRQRAEWLQKYGPSSQGLRR